MPYGSPPRLWGLLVFQREAGPLGRFTPTPVGIAAIDHSAYSVPPVHPHACGDCIHGAVNHDRTRGSPPRLWGLLCVRMQVMGNERFTPTPVGIACTHAGVSVAVSVHPHACGDCISVVSVRCFPYGSPPRLWGLQSSVHRLRCNGRFTPTPVGIA